MGIETMAVDGLMVDTDIVAVAAIVARKHDLAAGNGTDRRAAVNADVDAVVPVLSVVLEIVGGIFAKLLRDRPSHRPKEDAGGWLWWCWFWLRWCWFRRRWLRGCDGRQRQDGV